MSLNLTALKIKSSIICLIYSDQIIFDEGREKIKLSRVARFAV